MILYLDTSSLLKVYFSEEGTPATLALIRRAQTLSSSAIAYVEVRSGLIRGWRGRRLTDDEYATARSDFERDWSTYAAYEVTEALLKDAGNLAEEHFLRGLDAIHLASALALQRDLREPVAFSAADNRLMSAAVSEGLSQP